MEKIFGAPHPALGRPLCFVPGGFEKYRHAFEEPLRPEIIQASAATSFFKKSIDFQGKDGASPISTH
ncbi:hypothetical protein [Sphingobium sp. Cam5-1]|uniref:hypothetical protein n=1 Tax=Sphingobium sp. Cam5-1 TaxID=2789327 RepID=UPI0018AD28F5|nr:hypothetical protein [Sphingobium sp. Cam5-1]QPI75028.1 hypothetical protein IZV00_15110 [Sphingobium sp. Cam5-1]